MNTTFLLADDDADDAYLFRDTLQLVARDAVCYVVENGLKLFGSLQQYQERKPHIIFLDINMPRMNGWECLEQLKQQEAYSDIPVIMYSTSSSQRDIDKAYHLGALLFISKPEVMKELELILDVVVHAASPAEIIAKLRGHSNVYIDKL